MNAPTTFPARFELKYWDGVYRINADASPEGRLAIEFFAVKGDWVGRRASADRGIARADGWYLSALITPGTLTDWMANYATNYATTVLALAAPPETAPSFP